MLHINTVKQHPQSSCWEPDLTQFASEVLLHFSCQSPSFFPRSLWEPGKGWTWAQLAGAADPHQIKKQMIDPGTSWRWNQSPAKCGVVKNSSCSALIFTASLCARSRRGEGGKLLHFCCPSQTRNCENQAAIGFLQSRSSGITFLSGTTPRKGFRLGFARKTKLTPVTFPHDCMHRRTL